MTEPETVSLTFWNLDPNANSKRITISAPVKPMYKYFQKYEVWSYDGKKEFPLELARRLLSEEMKITNAKIYIFNYDKELVPTPGFALSTTRQNDLWVIAVPLKEEIDVLLQNNAEIFYKRKDTNLASRCFTFVKPGKHSLQSYKHWTTILLKQGYQSPHLAIQYRDKSFATPDHLKIAYRRLGASFLLSKNLRKSLSYYKRSLLLETNANKREKLVTLIKSITLQLLQDIPDCSVTPQFPNTIWLEIFEYLDGKEVVAAESVCKAWKSLVSDELWKLMTFRDFSEKREMISLTRVSSWKSYYKNLSQASASSLYWSSVLFNEIENVPDWKTRLDRDFHTVLTSYSNYEEKRKHVAQLLERGADPHISGANTLAVFQCKDDIKMLKLFADKGPYPKLLNYLEKDPKEMIPLFLKRAANEQEKTEYMVTMATGTVFEEAFQLYKVNKNNINATKDKNDPRTVLHLLFENALYFEDLKSKMNPVWSENRDKKALVGTVYFCAKYLIEHSSSTPNTNLEDKRGFTAITWSRAYKAIFSDNAKMFSKLEKLFLKYGSKDNSKYTYCKNCNELFHKDNNTNESCNYHPGYIFFGKSKSSWTCCKQNDLIFHFDRNGCKTEAHKPY